MRITEQDRTVEEHEECRNCKCTIDSNVSECPICGCERNNKRW